MKSLKLENLAEILNPLKERYEVILYGSQVEGGSRPDSDIDIAVITRESKIENNIEIQKELLGIFPLNFDVRVFELFPIYIQISIIETYRVIFGDILEISEYKEELLCISAITTGEIYDGLGYTKEKRGENIYKEIQNQFEKIFTEFEIIPITTDILKLSGMRKGELRANGITLDIGDCVIGITAKLIKAEKIVSRNPKHFSEFDVQVESYEIGK